MTKAHSNGGWKPPTVRIPSFDPDTDTLTAALEYANAGWYVIPVDKATKNPGSVVGKGWETKSSRDPQVVASWFAGSDYGIALHAGRSGVVVFDVDAPSQVPDTLAKWLDETVPYQSTRPDQPGRGHFVFTQPQVPVGNSLGSLPRGFGDVRGKNGVIVAYPTPHINGGRYLWERAGTVPPLPTEIEHALRTPTFHDTDTRPGEEYTALDADTQRRVDGWTHSVCDRIRQSLTAAKGWSEGERDEKGRGWELLTFQAAATLASLAKAAWCPLSPAAAEKLLRDHAPTDSTWTLVDVEHKWAAHFQRAQPHPWPQVFDSDTESYNPDTGSVGWLTDSMVAERFAEHVKHKFIHTPGLGWMRWDGRRWERCDETVVVEASRNYAKRMVRQAANSGNPEKITAYSRRLHKSAVRSVAELARGILRGNDGEFDQHNDLLNCRNGVVDLRTGEIRPHDPALRITKLVDVDYTPGAYHRDLVTALLAMPEPVADWMQVRFGQATTGYTPDDDIMPALHGGGENGKSTIVDVVLRVLGDYGCYLSENVLLGDSGAHPVDKMALRGARLGVFEEAPEGRRLNVKRLKDAIGRATMDGRYLYGQPVTWTCTHAIMLTTNHVLQVDESDHGTWRRLALVRFPFTFARNGTGDDDPNVLPADPGLRTRLQGGQDGQHEAVLAWLVDGARRWYDNGRVMPEPPQEVVDDTREWRSRSDQVLAFVIDQLEFAPNMAVLAKEMFETFTEWLEKRNQSRWSETTFHERFDSHRELTDNGVEYRQRVRTGNLDLSRKGLFSPPPERTSIYLGTRFRSDADTTDNHPSTL